jgi:methionine sulfoxide reductase heme-binding subunit
VIIILFSLIIGTINLLKKRANPVSTYFRRDFSIIGGILVIIHSVCGLFVHFRGNNWQYFLTKNQLGYSIRLDGFGLANYTGLISVLIIILLLVTSNDFLLRKLKPNCWKNIQRLSYFMFVFAIIHCIYYRIVADNFTRIFYLYIPAFLIVLTFQIIGIWLKLNEQNKN